MYYFDNKLLQQYLDQNVKLKIYANDEWYFIGNKSDIQEPDEASVYDVYGKASKVDYRDIEQIKVGNRVITLDALQQSQTGKPPEDTKKEPANTEEPPSDEMPEEEPPEEAKPKEKGPDLSWYSPVYELGRGLLKEAQRRKRR